MNVLIVGLGSIATKHVTALKEIKSDVEIYALRSSTSQTNKVKGIKNLYSFEELQTIRIDFAIISNPTFAHKETIENLIPYHIPLFIEKPLFSELDGGNLVKKIEEEKINSYVACNLRFLSGLKFVKEYIANRTINEVNIYCGSYLPDWRPQKDYKKSYSAQKELGGGVHIDLIHEIDYAYWLFGRPEKIHKTFSSRSSLKINSYDYANYLLSFRDFHVNIVLNYFRRDPKRTLEILLEEETITVDLLKNKVFKNSETIFESKKQIIDTYKDQLEFFINTILPEKEQFNPAEEAYEILKICLQND